MKLLPGQHEGESDIQIARSLAKKWQLGAWLDDAGSKASGRLPGRRASISMT